MRTSALAAALGLGLKCSASATSRATGSLSKAEYLSVLLKHGI